MGAAMKYEVLHFTLCDGWVNTWTSISEEGEETPTTFDTEEEAEQAIQFFLDDWEADCASNAVDHKYFRNEFKIVQVQL